MRWWPELVTGLGVRGEAGTARLSGADAASIAHPAKHQNGLSLSMG